MKDLIFMIYIGVCNRELENEFPFREIVFLKEELQDSFDNFNCLETYMEIPTCSLY